MEARYLNAYLKHIDKITVFENRLASLSITYPELKSITTTPPSLPVNTPYIITAEYLNTLFMYYYNSLYYLHGMAASVLTEQTAELSLIESRTGTLRKLIADTLSLAKRAKEESSIDYISIEDGIERTLKIHSEVQLHNTYLKLESSSTTYPTSTKNNYANNVRIDNRSPLKFAFDNDPLSTWCDYVVSYSTLNSVANDYTSKSALLLMTLEFDHIVPINKMVIYPLSGYPMSLKNVIFYCGTQQLRADNAPKMDYLHDNRNTFTFPLMSVDKIELLFEQEHYIITDDIKKIHRILDTGERVLVSKNEPPYSKMNALLKSELSRVSSLDPVLIGQISEILEIDKDSLPKLETHTIEYTYIFGARSIELYYTTYEPDNIVSTNIYDLDTNIYSISLETDDTFNDGDIITYYLKLSNGVEIPIIPTAHNNTVRERLYFTDRAAVTTFPSEENISVYRNDEQTTHFSSEILSDKRRTIELYDESNIQKDIFYCYYTSDDNRENIVLSDYLTYPTFIEEEINIISDNNLRLSNIPYLSTEIINDTGNFFRRSNDVAIYEYSSEPFHTVDNTTYGSFSSGYLYLSSDLDKMYTSITLTPSNFPSNSYVTIGDYTWKVVISSDHLTFTTGTDLTKCYETGINYPYVIGSDISGPITTYEPLIIEIDGVPAENITSYESHEMNMFTSNSIYQFTHNGKRVFFNKKPDGTVIAKYNTKIGFIQIDAALSRHTSYDASETPKVRKITASIKPRI